MAKRVFTRIAKGIASVGGMGFPEPGEQTGLYSWLLQEDIEIVGVCMSLWNSLPSENDGFAWCNLELSQTAEYGQSGSIASVNAMEGWNTTPAGICATNGHQVMNFPVGLSIPVKEEGHLYVNALLEGKSAGTSEFSFLVIIYYTMKGR
ncbi:unnamed protein product [marine sediment metagenome]|uniref:Uncharacterized protein n=1 Tax=marine sediment metagenome TaxID=412755 RepID=X1M8L3_9ZZZZ